jgi:hypothetical protein
MEKNIQICNENSVFLVLKLILEKPEKNGFFFRLGLWKISG